MVDRYLTEDGAIRALEQGRTIEQWLGARVESAVTVLKWLSIERERNGQTLVRLREVFDEGGAELLDVYEFRPYDVEAEEGIETHFGNWKEALQYSVVHLGADPCRFVNEGIVQLEYADYLARKN